MLVTFGHLLLCVPVHPNRCHHLSIQSHRFHFFFTSSILQEHIFLLGKMIALCHQRAVSCFCVEPMKALRLPCHSFYSPFRFPRDDTYPPLMLPSNNRLPHCMYHSYPIMSIELCVSESQSSSQSGVGSVQCMWRV